MADLARAVTLLETPTQARTALQLLSRPALQRTAIDDYVRFHRARALRMTDALDEAAREFTRLAALPADHHLPEAAAFALAELHQARGQEAAAVGVYEALVSRPISAPQVAWLRLGIMRRRLGDTPGAIEAYRRVYFDYPLSAESATAEAELTELSALSTVPALAPRELRRADALFQARRFEAARTAYARAGAAGLAPADAGRAQMRLAACDVRLRRYRQGLEALQQLDRSVAPDESGYYRLAALAGLGPRDTYRREAQAFVDTHPDSPFAAEALSDLATHFIVADEDDQADFAFRQIIDRAPSSRQAERAYWRSGWWAYRDRRFDEAAKLFDAGIARFPRADARPSWLYWSGRAWQALGDTARADERLRIAAIDYANSYYGRLARTQLSPAAARAVSPQFTRTLPVVAPPTGIERARRLMAAGLDEDALNELAFLQRTVDQSPALTATIALAQHRVGRLRAGINTMKRAYPHWMAVGGEALPQDMQRVIFPLAYWPLIQKYAKANGLDPYVVAALMAQESTFDPVIASSAKAVGLMQILPSTGRQFARKLKLARFTPARLTDPDTNVRLGTAILADSVREFGGVHYALAAYNAGPHRVRTWRRDRPGLPQDEFIDDIPFPETQNYVKRILGTADDYRRLYGR
jgi:soluble lytic murein transglycosylase